MYLLYSPFLDDGNEDEELDDILFGIDENTRGPKLIMITPVIGRDVLMRSQFLSREPRCKHSL